MIKKLTIIAALLLLASPVFAQHTTVTAQVMDVNGNLYRTCTGGANFVGQNTTPGAPPYSLSGAPFQTTVPISCDGAGNFTISLADNLLITPTPSQWNFSICSAIGAFPGPPICFNVLITITGATQNVTAQIQAAAVLLPVSGGSLPPAGNGTHVATTNLVTGGVAGNCVTWLTGGVLGDAGAACGSGGGGGTPPGSPNLSLQYNNATVFQGVTGTSFNATTGELDINNLANIRYATTALNWSQTIANPITGGSPSTVTLAPCPTGIDGRDNVSYLYVSGVGTPEPVKLTGGGTCRPGNASGTVNFTPANSHGGGYTIGSGSSGIQETINQFTNWTGTGGSGNIVAYISPAGSPLAQGNTTFAYVINAPITSGSNNNLTLVGDGAILACNTRDFCITMTTTTVVMKGIRMASNLLVEGWPITNVACSGGVATITTGVNHGFITGDFVDIHDTDDSFYWGGSVSQASRVTVTGATTFTYPIASGNCAAGGGSTRASLNTPGTANVLNAAYFGGQGGGSGSSLYGINFTVPGGLTSVFSGHFNNFVVVMDDEAFEVNHMAAGSLNAKGQACNFSTGKTYCGAAIYAPGPFTGGSGVLWINNSDLTMQCTGNPVVAFNGNTIHLNNVITQSQARVSVQASSRRGGFGNVLIDNVYDEQGNCTNPDAGIAASEGYSFWGNAARVSGGEGPQANIPNFGGAGGQTFNYYIIANNGSADAPPLFLGSGAPSGVLGIKYPRIMPIQAGTTNITYTEPTYSILRTPDLSNFPTTAACVGGAANVCGTVATAVAQCTTAWCTFTDNSATVTSSVAINMASAYTPEAPFWPGTFIMGGSSVLWLDSNTLLPGSGTFVTYAGPVTSNVYTLRNSGNTQLIAGFSTGAPANVLLDTSTTNFLKGGINVVHGIGASIPQGELVTLVDSNPTKTLASTTKRPTADANDTFIGNDNGSGSVSNVGLSFGAPLSISNYIGTAINSIGSGWLERLTAASKEFTVPSQFDAPMTAVTYCSGCSPMGLTGTQISDLFQRANGSVGANWTQVDGTCTISSQVVVFTHGGDGWTNCIYTGSSFSNDQYAQATINPGGGLTGVGVRMQNPATSGYFHYCSSSVGEIFGKVVAAAVTNFFTSATNCVNGDTLKIVVSGSTIQAYKNGTLVATQTDTTFTTGNPGIIHTNTLTGSPALYRFYAGNANWSSTQPISTITAQQIQTGSPVTFAALPACAGGTEGTLAAITDSNTAVWGANIAGGSTNHVLAYCDGTNWTVAAK